MVKPLDGIGSAIKLFPCRFGLSKHLKRCHIVKAIRYSEKICAASQT